MNTVQAAACDGSASAKAYRDDKPRIPPPRSKFAENLKIPYPFNPVPHELHRPAALRPDGLLFSDKALEQGLCALACIEGRPDEGIIRSVSMLAEYIGASDSTVRRSIKRLRSAGVIETREVACRTKDAKSPWRRYVYQFKIVAMSPPGHPVDEKPKSKEKIGENPFTVTVTSHDEEPNIRRTIKTETAFNQSALSDPVACARVRAHADDDEKKCIAKRDDATPKSEPGTEGANAETPGVVDWNSDESSSEQADISATQTLDHVTPEEQVPMRDGEIVPVPDRAEADRGGEQATAAPERPLSAPADAADRRAPSGRLADAVIIADPVREELAAKLRARGVWEHGVRKILKLRTNDEIAHGFADLADQVGIFRPDAWLYAHLVNNWDAIQQSKAAAAAMAKSEAQQLKAREILFAPRLTGAELDAAMETRRLKARATEATEAARLAAQTERETAALLNALSPAELTDLERRAIASLRGFAVPGGALRGAMVGILEADQLRAKREAAGRQALQKQNSHA